MSQIQGFILAGGQSRRMGTDKSRLTLGGSTFVDRIAVQLQTVTDRAAIVGSPSTGSLQLPTVADVYPRWGALGGVHAALFACSAEWALIVACDFPHVSSELFDHLAGLRNGWEAVAPIQEDTIPQPLCALYRVEPCRAVAEGLIKSGERKPIALLQSVRTRWIPFAEISHLTGAGHFFDNINTPEDYARISKEGVAPKEVQG